MTWRFRGVARAGAALCLTALAAAQPVVAEERTTATVFAAASLAGLIEDAAGAGALPPGAALRLVHASSGQLARQIAAGAHADAFIAADRKWTDELVNAENLVAGEAIDLFGGALVLVAPEDSDVELVPVPGSDLLALLGDSRLAMGDPAHVPAGAYARDALQWLGAWNAIEPRAAFTDDVRQALAFVARGEAALAIVYLSDAIAEQRVRVVANFPPESHQPILYSGVAIAGGETGAARALFAYLRSPRAAGLLERRGFVPLERRAPPS